MVKQCRNKFERQIASQLSKKGVEYEYESEWIPFTIHSHYIPDFVLSTGVGKLYIECKGLLRREDQRKLTAVKSQRPELDLRIVFYRQPNKRIQKWCAKINLPWAVQTIPKEWLPKRKKIKVSVEQDMVKHPKTRGERMKINEKKRSKREALKEVSTKSSRTVSSDIDEEREDN